LLFETAHCRDESIYFIGSSVCIIAEPTDAVYMMSLLKYGAFTNILPGHACFYVSGKDLRDLDLASLRNLSPFVLISF
jgi:hypothetical protein